MMAFAASKIIMGKQSSLGPIDPIINGIPADGVVQEIEKIYKDVTNDPNRGFIWRPILEKYRPTFIGICENACSMAKEMSTELLKTGMFPKDADNRLEDKIINYFSSHKETKMHDRHIPAEKCKELGLKIEALENSQKLQDAVLAFHHTVTILIDRSPVVKIIGNHEGKMYVNNYNQSQNPHN